MKIITKIYLVFIHIMVLIIVVKTNFIPKVKTKLGYTVQTPELTVYYTKMLTFQKRMDKNIPPDALFFIGDSLIQGLAVNAVSQNAINFGIGQDTTKGVLNRIPLYSSLKKAKLIVIAIGINDLNRRNNTKIINNYLKIISSLPHNIPILFSAILPVSNNENNIIFRIKKLNDKLHKICNQYDNIFFLDMAKFITNSKGILLKKYHIGDGLHLNKKGNEIWIKKLKQHVNKILLDYY